jgi:hypothetical protein
MSEQAILIEILDDFHRARWAVIEDHVVIWSGPTKELGLAWANRHDIKISKVLTALPDALAS